MSNNSTSDKAICFIMPSVYGYFNPNTNILPGGAQRQIYLLAKELEKNIDVSFIVGDYGQPLVETREGITLYRSYKPSKTAGVWDRISHLQKLYMAIKRADADIYVTRGQSGGRAAFDYLFTTLEGKEWVFNSVSEPYVHERLIWPIKKIFQHGIKQSTVICQTDLDAELLCEHYGINPVVVHNGYSTVDSIVEYPDREYFIWVGRITKKQKQPHLYLDLAEKVPDENFLLIGPPDDRDTYVKRIFDRCERMSNVEYVGKVPPDEIHEYYQDAKALISTSISEGFPNVFLEAWRYGTPVLSLHIDMEHKVGRDFPGYAEGDFVKLVQDTQNIAADIETRRTWGNSSKEIYEDNFKIEVVAQKYLDALLE